MKAEAPARFDLVLIGGGHAHVEVVKSFGMRAMPGVRVTVVTRDAFTPYSGMIPGHIAGHYPFDACHVDLGPLSRFAGARLIHAPVTGLDPDARLIEIPGRPPLPYDACSIDIGSTPPTQGIPGADEHAIRVKPLDGFLAAMGEEESRLLAAGGRWRLVVVGGGAGGVELALALRHRLGLLLAAHGAGAAASLPEIRVIAASEALMPGHAPAAARRMARALARKGIEVETGTRVERIEAGRLVVRDREPIAFDTAIMATGAEPAPWLASTGLALDPLGFVRVDSTLRSVSHERVFAAGDVAAFDPRPLPKSGVYAVRQGPALALNLRRLADGRSARPFRPQRVTLALVSTGDRHAVASWGPLAWEGDWVWRWKDHIDRRWMDKYRDLPDMSEDAKTPARGGNGREAPAPTTMRCGGCGAKVASPVVRRVLDRLAPAGRADVDVGLTAPDDAAVITPPPGQRLVQTVDHFRSFVSDPWLFGRIAANHCLSDIHAMGATPHSALAIVQLPHAGEPQVESDLEQLLAGALVALDEAGCALIGGHTAEAAELGLGFAINGFLEPERLTGKAGARPGDRLVLTKPLGTGTLFAADMAGKARSAWVETATAAMCRSNGPAASILFGHGARSVTDVTGFGLLGHLIEMARASGTGADLDLLALPALPGAAECLRAGIRSTLDEGNRAFAEMLDAPATGPRFDLLFDPQTAGGLLAAVPAEEADACLAALHAAGDGEAAVVGRVRSAPGIGWAAADA